MKPPSLIGLTYSPWTEKARWALDHCKIPYHYQMYSPLFGELSARLKTKCWRQKITVPILLSHDPALMDSFHIAQWAARRTENQQLFCDLEEVTRWNALSESALAAGRALLTCRVSQDSAAKTDYLPPWLPKVLWGTLGPGLAKTGIAFFRFKYRFSKHDTGQWLKMLTTSLEEMAVVLSRQNYLLGRFSFADIAMAVVLQFVKPVENQPIKIPARSAGCWETPDLQERFGHLLAWRDELYANHR